MAVRGILADIRSEEPLEPTCRLDFEPGDAVQVDFGAGPMLMHPDGKIRRTWAFVMTLLLRPCEVLSRIANSPILEAAHNALRVLLQHRPMLVGGLA